MFEVVFQGKIVAGSDLEQVRQNVGRMFKADEAKLNALFSGKVVVIKAGLDQATAQKYVAAMKKAGAIAEIRDSAEKTPPKPEAPQAKNPASFTSKEFSKPSLSSVAQAKEQQRKDLFEQEKEDDAPKESGIPVPEVTEAPTAEVQAAMAKLSQQEEAQKAQQERAQAQTPKAQPSAQPAGDFSIAPTGAMILPESDDKDPEAPNTDHLSVKPMEGYLVDPEPEKEVQVPDVSHLKIEE